MGLKFFDLFAGIGGFRLGMERAGHTCVGSCEWDIHARETYKKNFGSYPEYDDAKDLHPQSLPSFDVLCAGFPCQAFSIAGKRLGFEDTRGTVFFEIARIAKEKRPSYLLLENVRGLLSHDKGRTFATIVSTLDALGYDAEWQVLNSKFFVPQNRERVFIVGHLRGERTRQIFPLGDFDSETNQSEPKEKVGVVNDKGNLREVEQATCLDANYWKGCDNHAQRTMIYLSNTNANMKQRIQERKETWTLGTGTDFGIKDGMRIRKLTPVECERLQGFPDGWTIGSDTQRYKQCGNAVTVHVVEYIARELRLG
jgi:DNA (cytosine-5)-methyltransferase 1